LIVNDYYSQEIHGPYELHNIGDLVLEDGGVIHNCELAYSTHGSLNDAKDNAILVTTWHAGTSKIMDDAYIGEGRALDPATYFIIVINQIGSGLSSSPHNTPSPGGMAEFPNVRIADDVRAQHRLLTEKFHIEKLELVLGGSMGAQQTYEWAVQFPHMVKRAAPIAGTAKTTEHNMQIADAMNDAIKSGPGWNGGDYSSSDEVLEGLRRQARLWALVGLSPAFFNQQTWKGIGFSSTEDFMVNFLEADTIPMDPNDLICQGWKWREADVARHTGGDLAQALGRIQAKMFVLPIDTDVLFPPVDCAVEQKMVMGSELRVIKTVYGHLGVFAVEQEYRDQIDKHLSDLLARPV
jgi:homoserine O-acetyltransferase/O-succinyltransferase